MYHCAKFNAYNTWYLDNIDNFESRELRLGFCPQCKQLVGELIERRITDNKLFKDVLTGTKLEKVMNRERGRTQYTSTDFLNYKCMFGWRYGENKEVVENKIVKIKQFSVDFNGSKELVKTNVIN